MDLLKPISGQNSVLVAQIGALHRLVAFTLEYLRGGIWAMRGYERELRRDERG